MTQFLFFARVRERIGSAQLDIPLPKEVRTVAQMLDHLRGQGEPFTSALAGSHLRIAVNQSYAQPNDPVDDKDEVAIFPPVSGG
ncbi:MAG: molybdopterin converting factor subunit 1 [Magnetococcus sp. DMHC-6]